jgi:hypothetical protein
MEESKRWKLERYVALLVVLALHLALLTVLVMTSTTRTFPASKPHSVELLTIPPANVPKIRSENPQLRRLSTATAISIAPPTLDSTSTPPASGSDGNGARVDWVAEARRALQAFEIRNHAPEIDNPNSGWPPEDDWWPQARHHAGEQFKTASGDWIVWINSSCYQIASSVSPASALGATPPKTVCPGEDGKPRGEPSKETSARTKKLHPTTD